MKEIKILPHTIVAFVVDLHKEGHDSNAAADVIYDQIMPVLNSHNIVNKWYSLAQVRSAEKDIAYPSQFDVSYEFIANELDLVRLKYLAEKHNFNLQIFSVFDELANELEIKDYISIDVKEKYLVTYEEKLNVVKRIEDTNFAVVGDIHGSYESFIAMLRDDKGIRIHNNKIEIIDPTKYVKHILVGDYVDKGNYKGIRKMIEFLYDNLEHFYIVIGNHEHWVAKYLLGELKPSHTNTALIGSYFSTVVLLLQDAELRRKFFVIYNASYSCVDTPLAIVTHAPCRNKYLGKTDDESIKRMRNMVYPKTVDYASVEEYLEARKEFFMFLQEEADMTHKYHIFGHTMLPEVFKLHNKICIDTGCVAGGTLTVALFKDGDLDFKSYENKNPVKIETLLPYFYD